MGHALEKIHQRLNPIGCLIDIHPIGEPPPVTVRIKDEQFLMGWVLEDSDYMVYDEANEALETAVSNGLFRWNGKDTFAFLTYFDELSELQDHIAEEWTAASLDEQVAMQITSRMQVPTPDKEIILEEIVRIGRLDPAQ